MLKEFPFSEWIALHPTHCIRGSPAPHMSKHFPHLSYYCNNWNMIHQVAAFSWLENYTLKKLNRDLTTTLPNIMQAEQNFACHSSLVPYGLLWSPWGHGNLGSRYLEGMGLHDHGASGSWVWEHGTLGPKVFGIMKLWDHGTLGPYGFETTELWDHGTFGPLELWDHGTSRPWDFETMGLWDHRTLGLWGFGRDPEFFFCLIPRFSEH